MKNKTTGNDDIATLVITEGVAAALTASEDIELTARILKIASEIQTGDYFMHGSNKPKRRQCRSITANDVGRAMVGVFDFEADEDILDHSSWASHNKRCVTFNILKGISVHDTDLYEDIMHDALSASLELSIETLFITDLTSFFDSAVEYLASSIKRHLSDAITIMRLIELGE